MSAYNMLLCTMGCPRCGQRRAAEVNMYFGIREMRRFRLGERYLFREGVSLEYGGRPPEERSAGDGWTECAACGRDFYVRVLLEGDVLSGVEPDLMRVPMSGDNRFDDLGPCPGCSDPSPLIDCYEPYQLALLHCTCEKDFHQLLLAKPYKRGERPVLIGDPQPIVPSTFRSGVRDRNKDAQMWNEVVAQKMNDPEARVRCPVCRRGELQVKVIAYSLRILSCPTCGVGHQFELTPLI